MKQPWHPPLKIAGAARKDRARRVLVLGGSRSGKSVYAESLLRHAPTVLYVAPGALPTADDPEWAARIGLHRARRPGNWRTAETTDLAAVLAQDGPPALIDDLSSWLAAAMDECGVWTQTPGADDRLAGRIEELVQAWIRSPRHVVAVSNEVGSGVVPATSSGRRFRDELGRLNARIAAQSPQVWFVTAGLPRALKGPGIR
jgi:adenosylcobinamide kinase/adenosylcobinamide-phosphate guanylyltransferase